MNRKVVCSITFLMLSTHLITNSLTQALTSAAEVAKRLNKRYEDEAKICEGKDKHGNSVTRPAYECSGIIIRGINSELNLPHFWSKKPANRRRKSVSFAFLRQDAKWSKFPRNYVSGFILHPNSETPEGKNTSKVYCAFPLNGATDQRGGRHACGRSTSWFAGAESKHCDQFGVTDFNSWKAHFTKYRTLLPRGYMARQCAFDMTMKNAPTQFNTVLEAKKFLNNDLSYGYMMNELVIRLWDDQDIKKLPIEAIFYLSGDETGKNRALEYQEDFKKESGGELVPIVKIQFPTRTTPFRADPHF